MLSVTALQTTTATPPPYTYHLLPITRLSPPHARAHTHTGMHPYTHTHTHARARLLEELAVSLYLSLSLSGRPVQYTEERWVCVEACLRRARCRAQTRAAAQHSAALPSS